MANYLQTGLTFIIVLGSMVVIHEFGHFIVAKLFGVRVETFSVGFGKRLWGFKKGDTDYRLSLIPLGGYVKMAGEQMDDQATGAPDEFTSKPKYQRFLIALAGPTMNVLTALAIPMVMAMVHYNMPAFLAKPTVVAAVEPGTAGENAGIKAGDLITQLDGMKNPDWEDVLDRILLNPGQELPLTISRDGVEQRLTLKPDIINIESEKVGYAGIRPILGPKAKLLITQINSPSPALEAGLKEGDQLIAFNGAGLNQDYTGRVALINGIIASQGKPVTITVKRGDDTFDIAATPKVDKDGRPRLGFGPDAVDGDIISTKLSLPAALRYSVNSNIRLLKLNGQAFYQVFTGRRSFGDTVAGPIQILKFSGEAAKLGIGPVFELMALLSLSLGIFNLLPIPVLDGGLIFMLGLESLLGLVGLPLTRTLRERMTQVGFVLLMALMAFVIFNDIRRQIPKSAESQQVEQAKPAPK